MTNYKTKRHQPRVTGEIKYRGCRAKVHDLPVDEFMKTIEALQCKTG